MDAPGCDVEGLEEALDALAAANRWLGGRRAVLSRARPFVRGENGRLRILDVGCGPADIPEAWGRRLSGRRPGACLVLADVHAETLRCARRRVRSGPTVPGVDFAYVRLDGALLPFRDDAFDVGLCSGTLHHLETPAAARLLAELHRVSRRGWVVTDLRRSPLVYAVVRLLAATVWRRRPFPRQDGPTSVRRSFTASEARELVTRAGLGGVATVEGGPFRIAIRGGREAA